MVTFWKRYQTVLTSQEFIITATTALLLLVSVSLDLAGTGYWVYTSVALAAVAVGGIPIIISAIKGLLQRQMNVDELVAIAIIASVIFEEYLSAGFVAFMMLFGKILEDFTAARAKTALEDLGKLVPATVCVRRDGEDSLIPIEQVVPGDLLITKSGERIAVDGVVISGQASVNQAPITGESMPVAKAKGSEVYAGTLNELGALEIRTSKVGDATTLGQVMHLVEEAEENRAPIVRIADQYARYFTPLILTIAILVYAVTRNVTAALAVLIVACPCALVMATPTAIIAGVANGARRGILIKGGARLEAAGRVTAVAIDKTGTITLGEPSVVRIITFDGMGEQEVLQHAAIAERSSEHLLGKAILNKAREWGLKIPAADEFQAVPGQGAIALLDNKQIMVGTEALLLENRVSLPPGLAVTLTDLEKEGLTPLLVASAGKTLGVIGVADIVREDMRQAIQNLRSSGVKKVVMMTGDSPEIARRVASAVGIDEWQARLLPHQKVESIKALQRDGYRVAMFGDGINDAPALAQADVGVAMGITGTDIAMDTADIVLMKDDTLKAAEAINLSHNTLKTIKQNLAFALFFNLIGVGLAASGMLSPIAAAIFHNIGSVAVVVNSARLVTSRNLSRK
ncbi:MAG: cation-translocating P-type ATPase [Dehalococcoidales bacterium]|nr:cation-translocating P-type ATPase [Dehalococcoidales bacterium]